MSLPYCAVCNKAGKIDPGGTPIRIAREAERENWLAQVEFSAPAREWITAVVSDDSELASRLWASRPHAEMNQRLAIVFPFLIGFLRSRHAALGLWEDFSAWLAEMISAAEIGEGIGWAGPEDELEELLRDDGWDGEDL